MSKSPILFITFNRFNETKLVFNTISNYKPNKLFISSDGPRVNKEGEDKIIFSIRKYILDNIDWECEIYTLFKDVNLGCNAAVTDAIDWFFVNVEQGIILEDDCISSDSFFIFCNNLLEKYKYDNRISGITGTNFNDNLQNNKYSYFFSEILIVWGWATWRRSWYVHRNNYNISNLEFKHISYHDKVINQSLFDYANIPNGTWDFKMWLSFYVNNMVAIVPQKNLIKNIGFTKDATVFNINLKKSIKKFQRIENTIDTNLVHPNIFRTNYEYDNFIFVKQLNFKKFNKRKFIIKWFGNSVFLYLKRILRFIYSIKIN